jgi:hypothetical protein
MQLRRRHEAKEELEKELGIILRNSVTGRVSSGGHLGGGSKNVRTAKRTFVWTYKA